MVDSSILVEPDDGAGALEFKLVEIDGQQYPVYIAVDSNGDFINAGNPLPVAAQNTEAEKHNFSRTEELLEVILLQMKIANAYMALAYDTELTENDIEE